MCPPFSLLGSSLAFSLASRIGFQGSSSYFQFGSVCRISYDLENYPARPRRTYTQHLQRERERVTRVYPVLTYSYRYESCRCLEREREGGRGWILPWYVTGRCNQEQFTNSARCIGTDLLPSWNLVISIVSMNNVVQSNPSLSIPLSMPAVLCPPRKDRSLLPRSLEMRGEKFETTKQSFVIIIIY